MLDAGIQESSDLVSNRGEYHIKITENKICYNKVFNKSPENMEESD